MTVAVAPSKALAGRCSISVDPQSGQISTISPGANTSLRGTTVCDHSQAGQM